MITVIVTCVVTCAAMIACVLIKPEIKVGKIKLGLYWLIVLAGAIVLLSCGRLTFTELVAGLTADTAINPLKILVLFISMTVLSIFLDEVGFFRYLANETLRRAKASQRMLFFYLYLLVSVLTVFTSNDIIILTFTPFICYFAKNAKISPVPYLVAEFVAANTWSMALIIGNPTNIYLATACGIDFVGYLRVMLLPTFLGGAVAFGILYLLFRRALKQELMPVPTSVRITDKPLLIIGIAHLGLCTVLLAISSFINLQMWLVTLCFAGSLFLTVLLYKLIKKQKPTELINCLKRAPWELIPFVLSMFVLVLALNKYGVTAALGGFFGAGSTTILKYGFGSLLFANLINNIPMSVLFSVVVQSLTAEYAAQGLFATVVGSNIGAFLTPVGALAGIMWSNILKTNDVRFSFIRFAGYGFAVALPALLATLAGLYLMFAVI